LAPRSERVLLTGGDSFTGIPLAKALRADGHEVVTVGRRHGNGDVIADLMLPDPIMTAVAHVKPTVIVHLAAMTFAADTNLHGVYTTNVSGTASLLKGARAHAAGLTSVILASSGKVYAPAVSADPIHEDYPLQPGDHYGASKLAMEHVARLFADDLPITVVRPFNYTGPGQAPHFFVPKLVQAFASAQPVRVGNLDLARDFSDISTVVEVYRRLVAQPQPGGIFNICSGKPVQLRTIIETLEDLTQEIEITVDPAFMRADEPPVIVGSRERLEKAVGALPAPPLRDTLQAMIRHRNAA
jgi:nucleoside-diphosphate-sugar epimerase